VARGAEKTNNPAGSRRCKTRATNRPLDLSRGRDDDDRVEEETTWRGVAEAPSRIRGGPVPHAATSRPAPRTMASGPQPDGLPPSHRAMSQEVLNPCHPLHRRRKLCLMAASGSDKVRTHGRRGRWWEVMVSSPARLGGGDTRSPISQGQCCCSLKVAMYVSGLAN
jgi:hypothetical protein